MLPPTAAGPPEIDTILRTLLESKSRWAATTPRERAAILRRCIAGLVEAAPAWVREACASSGIDAASPLSGEPLISGPVIAVRYLRLLAEGLERGGVLPHGGTRATASGRIAARVLPISLWDRILYRGLEGEVWIEPGKPPSQGSAGRREGGIALVLGAGNVHSIPVFDAVYQLVVENRVVALKLNPVNAWLAPILTTALAPLVKRGFLAIATGGADVGRALVQDSRVDAIHLTGSRRTFDAILWGTDPEERRRRLLERAPLVAKPITAELGSVTPILIVPGPWSRADVSFQAHHVASMVAHNASFNCNAAKVLVLARGWPLHDDFLLSLRRAFATIPPRRAWYPGAADRHRGFLERYREAERIGEAPEGALPWTLIPGVPPTPGEHALSEEAFCSVLAVVSLDAATPEAFLERAVPFVNESVAGTLSAGIFAHPATERRLGARFARAVEGLRYGAVGINLWPAAVFALGTPTWGAYPGHTIEDAGSGIGAAHNALRFDHPERSFVRGPFRPWPKPVWFAGHRTLRVLAERLLRFEASPSLLRVPGLLATAIRG